MESKNSKELHLAKTYQIVSFNVDGLRESVWKWIKTYLTEQEPHIFCLNETKTDKEELRKRFAEVETDYHSVINAHAPARWHGVALLIRKNVSFREEAVDLGKCPPRSDNTTRDPAAGRVVCLCVDDSFYVVATYVPNAGADRKHPLKNLSYRTQEWDPALMHYLNVLRLRKPTLWIGDINVAPDESDVSDAKRMKQWAGFTKEERANFTSMLASGEWIDIWRQQHPKQRAYSWRGRSKQSNNYGMRLDNALVSKTLAPHVTDSFVMPSDQCTAETDHVPVGVVLQFANHGTPIIITAHQPRPKFVTLDQYFVKNSNKSKS